MHGVHGGAVTFSVRVGLGLEQGLQTWSGLADWLQQLKVSYRSCWHKSPLGSVLVALMATRKGFGAICPDQHAGATWARDAAETKSPPAPATSSERPFETDCRCGAQGGDLRTALWTDDIEGTFEWGWHQRGRAAAVDIAESLDFLHSNGIVHR